MSALIGNHTTSDNSKRSSTKFTALLVLGTYLQFSKIRSGWSGWAGVQNFIVFGDSYSSTKFQEQSSWVDHIAEQQHDPTLHIQNYACPGDTAYEDLEPQVDAFFTKKGKTADFDAATTLYVAWIGINDCGTPSLDKLDVIVKQVFDSVRRLYADAGARQFLFINTPPLQRSPVGTFLSQDLSPRYISWNTHLHSETEKFAQEKLDVTTFVFDSYAMFEDILDDPEEYGFTEKDAHEAGWSIWYDTLHPTAAVHSIIADSVVAALS